MRALKIIILVSLHAFVLHVGDSLAELGYQPLEKNHLSEDVSTYFRGKVANRDPNFSEVVTRHLNETQDLLKNIKNQISTENKGKNWRMSSTHSDLIESKIYQLENMRDGVLQQLGELGVGIESGDIKAAVDKQSVIPRKIDTKLRKKRNRKGKSYKAEESAPTAFKRKINKLIKLLTALQDSKGHKKITARLNKVQRYVKQLAKTKTGRKVLFANPGSIQPFRVENIPTIFESVNSEAIPAYVAQNDKALNMYAAINTDVVIDALVPTLTENSKGQCNYVEGDISRGSTSQTEVLQTYEIKALAQKLNYSVREIFEYVQNEIDFEPYVGSLKGAEATLVSGAGNGTDHASLLIALLRASKIPSRYVRGVASFQNDSRVLNWIGANSFEAARSILWAKGYEVFGSGNDVGFNHVWVTACVPYVNYRGSTDEDTGYPGYRSIRVLR